MKIARYEISGQSYYGRLESDGTLHRLVGSPFDSVQESGETEQLETVRLLTPVPAPRIFGVGLNYVGHIKESGSATPEFPMLFMKPSTAVIGSGENIVYPTQGKVVHFEGELVAVIGKTARRVPESEALEYVCGYCCGNDVSERVIQRAEMKTGCMFFGKGFDTFAPVGPYVETDVDPTNLELTTRLNGEVKQHTNTSDLLFSVTQLVSYMSHIMTLLPGDLIMTGTPDGVGPIAPGDTVEVEISGIGILRNPVVAE
jgi:2-keto-4-pentenoate hydratase/2-oxohepta-3-ene-1,7-dioic acid hydratase in catechol pathway